MNNLLFTIFIAFTMVIFSGCTYKTVNKSKKEIVLPDCVPGPYGDCIKK